MSATAKSRVLGRDSRTRGRAYHSPARAFPLALARRLAVDVRPLRESRDFRLLWCGELISQTGSQITMVALFVQVDRLTGSTAAVGAIGLVNSAP